MKDQYDEITRLDVGYKHCNFTPGSSKRYIEFDIPYLDKDIEDPHCVEVSRNLMTRETQSKDQQVDPQSEF